MDPKELTDLKVSVGVIESQVNDMKKQSDRIEAKIDRIKYVTKEEFDEHNKEAKETYVTKEEIKPMKTLFWTIIGSLITGVIGLGFLLLQGQLK